MSEELELTPTPGPFFKFTDEAAWLTAARAAGFMITVTDEEVTKPNNCKHIQQIMPLMLSEQSPRRVNGIKMVM